jgi:hypothetical protein
MWDTEDDKIRVNFSISLYGKTQTFNGVYEDSTNWQDILGDVVSTLESAYGYTFNMGEELGIYYKGKENEC